MGKKSGPSPPDPPDPHATASAQFGANTNAAIANATMQNIREVGPYGTISYRQTGSRAVGGDPMIDTQTGLQRIGPDGQPMFNATIDVPEFERITQLTPQEQALYDSSARLSQGALNTGYQLLNNASGAIGQGFQLPDSPGQVMGVNAGPLEGRLAYSGPVQFGYQPGGQVQYGPWNQPGAMNMGVGGAGQGVQTGFDTQGLPALTSDFSADRMRYEQAIRARQDEDFAGQEAAMRTQLANQGIAPGTEAFDAEMRNLTRARNDAGMQARLEAGQEQARMQDMQMRARGQGFGEQVTAGQFGNQAQQQSFAQRVASGEFGNRAQQQMFEQDQALLDAYNRGVISQEQLNAQRTAFANQAQEQLFGQNNVAANFANTAQGQVFQQGLANAGLQNDARAQAIQEIMLERNQPINEVATLFGLGNNINLPQFNGGTNYGIQGGDVQGNTYANYQGAMQAWQQQSQNRMQTQGQMFGLLGQGLQMGGMAAMMSDRRMKEDIERVGKTDEGLPIYTFRYKHGGPTQMGVMAQDVERKNPDAVGSIFGIKHVDYRQVA